MSLLQGGSGARHARRDLGHLWSFSSYSGSASRGNSYEPRASSIGSAKFIHILANRNNISRPTYHRLRAEGRGPVEMRLGLNAIRISAEAERNWQQEMQKPRPDLEARTAERAVMAGDAAVKSDRHVSKRRRRAK